MHPEIKARGIPGVFTCERQHEPERQVKYSILTQLKTARNCIYVTSMLMMGLIKFVFHVLFLVTNAGDKTRQIYTQATHYTMGDAVA